MSKRNTNRNKTPNRHATRGYKAQPKPQRQQPRYDNFGFLIPPRTVAFGEHRRYLGLLNNTQARGFDGVVVGDYLSMEGITEREGWTTAAATWVEGTQSYFTRPGHPAAVEVHVSMATISHPEHGERTIGHAAITILTPREVTVRRVASIDHDLVADLVMHYVGDTLGKDDPIEVRNLPIRLVFPNSAPGSTGVDWAELSADERKCAFSAEPVGEFAATSKREHAASKA